MSTDPEYGKTGRGQGWRKLNTNDDDILQHYRLWLLKVATEFAPHRPDIWHDLAQEGHIAMWRALRTFDPERGSLPSWLTRNARMRMVDVLRRGDLWFGTDNPRGKERFPTATPVAPDADLLMGVAGDAAVDEVAVRYHDGDIAQALSELPAEQREYVLRRFWGDASYTDLFVHFRKNPTDIWRVTKPKLQRSLARLAAA